MERPAGELQPTCHSSEPLLSLLSSVVCRHVFLSFRGFLTDSLFVTRLGYLTAVRVAFVKQLRKKVAIPVFVEDQFACWLVRG